MAFVCAVYGGADYTNSWIGINAMVILASLMAISAVYSISKLLPDTTRGKITSYVRSEMTQLLTSAVIIVALISVTAFSCNISASISQTVTGQQLDPFAFATSYMGNLVFNQGFSLLTNVYSEALTYELYSFISAQAGLYLNNYIGELLGPAASAIPGKGLGISLPASEEGGSPQQIISVSFPPELDIGIIFTNLAETLLGLFSPMLTLAISTLLIQYITLPFLQGAAFSIVLPVAIALRSLAFTNGELRSAANALLAIAIAGYIVYPLTIVFDSYVMGYLFTANNPSYPFLHLTYVLQDITPNGFFSQGVPGSASGSSPWGGVFGSMVTLITGSAGTGGFPIPLTGLGAIHPLVNEIAQFLFVGVVLFAINVAITVGFAMGLAKGLNSGIEGAQNFWAGL